MLLHCVAKNIPEAYPRGHQRCPWLRTTQLGKASGCSANQVTTSACAVWQDLGAKANGSQAARCLHVKVGVQQVKQSTRIEKWLQGGNVSRRALLDGDGFFVC